MKRTVKSVFAVIRSTRGSTSLDFSNGLNANSTVIWKQREIEYIQDNRKIGDWTLLLYTLHLLPLLRRPANSISTKVCCYGLEEIKKTGENSTTVAGGHDRGKFIGKVGRLREKCAPVYLAGTRKLLEGGAILPRSGTPTTNTTVSKVSISLHTFTATCKRPADRCSRSRKQAACSKSFSGPAYGSRTGCFTERRWGYYHEKLSWKVCRCRGNPWQGSLWDSLWCKYWEIETFVIKE